MKTNLGKWSVWLIVAFVLFFLILNILVWSGQRGGETFFSNPYLAISGLLAAFSAIASFFLGLVSIIKDKEHSILVIIATVIGFLVFLFVLGEIVSPH